MKRRERMLNAHQIRLFLIIALLMVIGFRHCICVPLNNPFDTQPIYNAFGLDQYYKEQNPKENFFVRFHFSPFYQCTSTARDNHGVKVPLGDRLGKWNLFGLFFGSSAAPTPFDFTDPNAVPSQYVNLAASYTALAAIVNATTTNENQPVVGSGDRYRLGSPYIYDSANGFNPLLEPFVYVMQPSEYEKSGVRSQLNFDLWFGLGFAVKAGAVDIKNSPSRFISDSILSAEALTGAAPSGTTPAPGPDDIADAKVFVDNLFSPAALNLIAQSFNLDLTPFHRTAMEDVLVQMYWRMPFNFRDKSGDVALRLIPYVSVGAWFPTGLSYDQNKAFSVPTGNNGHYVFIAETSLGFDFPIIPASAQTLQFVLSGGLTAACSKTIKQQRFPSSIYQSGIFPWQTDVDNRPGLTWYFSTSLKAEEFVEGLSVYLDYVYTQHMHDHVTILQSNPTRLAAFQTAQEIFVEHTDWRNQQFNVGFNYRLADYVSLGGAAQAHISGTRVARSVTLLMGVTMAF